MHAIFPLPVPVLIVVGGAVAGLVGLGMGYLTLRLRGVFFAIATLALAVVLETFIVNWSFVGGSRGAYVIPPEKIPVFGPYIQYLFVLMLVLVIVALTTARLIERSRLGFGFATIRDDELAAEASGVPTLKLKLIATVVSGALMGMAGAPFPFYIGYVEPGLGVQSVLRGEFDRHADDRRHHVLGRPAGRRAAARHPAAGRHRHDLLGGQSADRRPAADRLRDRGAERHRRALAGLDAQEADAHDRARCCRSTS